MNRQDIFDKVKAHAQTQNVKSELSTSTGQFNQCLYRGPNGTKCFIGVLIPDELYSPRIENAPVDMLPMEIKIHLGIENTGDLSFMVDLQIIHDQFEPHHWGSQFTKFAVKYGLAP